MIVPRAIRCAAFCLCSPILLPFLCLADLFLRCCRRLRRRAARRAIPKSAAGSDADAEGEKLRRCEEGCGCGGGGGAAGEGDQMGLVLLQRYLEDQLLLARSVYDCGDDGERNDGFATPLLN